MKIALLPFWFCCFIISLPALAQTEEEDKERKPHRLTLMMANSHIPSADNVNGDKRIFIVPSWGLNYDYWISEKWAFGLHNDRVLQQYKVEDENEDRVIERSFPFQTWRYSNLPSTGLCWLASDVNSKRRKASI